MLRLTNTTVYLTGWLMLVQCARADSILSDHPYSLIATRNVFGLNPLQAQPVEAPASIMPAGIISPKGIMSIFGQQQVLFKVAATAKSGPASKETSYILAAGQEQDGIIVVNIDETASLVTFNNHGDIQKIPLPNASTSGSSLLAKGGPIVAPAPYKPHMVGAIGSGRIPSYLSNGDENGGQSSPVPKTGEEQMVMIEALRAYYKSQNDPRASSLPPTALTPPDAFEPAATSP